MFAVDGAGLHYEVRGAGPALLMISGAGGDARYYDGVAETLSDAFMVISYDRRGNSRSSGRSRAPMELQRRRDHRPHAGSTAPGGDGGPHRP